jgi:uncharacterized membrane protein
MNYFEKTFLYKLYTKRSDPEQVIVLFSLFSMCLVGFRVLYTGNLLFLFLVWNLFLAIVPYFISCRIGRYGHRSSAIGFFLSVLGWLLFIPNSFYIITDLFHLDMNEEMPLWFDLALILSFAWSGLLLGVLSTRQMVKIMAAKMGKHFEGFFILPIMFLNGLGIYVGRYLRFNSWDIVTDPFDLTREMVYLFIHPVRNRIDWSMIVCYSILVGLIYLTFTKLSMVEKEKLVV